MVSSSRIVGNTRARNVVIFVQVLSGWGEHVGQRGGRNRKLAYICSSGHYVGRAAKLALDLLTGPAGRLNGTLRKFTV